MADRVPVKRCAIYVRKSSEEGLDMSYNSLEAQSDACAAYIASQRHEGWVKLSAVYEDGGYSGGNMDRPGLQQLFADVGNGKIDIIVVYKIDRLTRSLTDFAKLNEMLDKNQVSFVAVTQQFNTSTSMGRLTLNVLLSFAQFEREVTGERIRDKVAASKKKGIWMGGPVPLGYAVSDRKLIVVPDEAAIVCGMFARYLELRSVHHLQRELQEQGVRSRLRPLKDGRELGGVVIGRGAISHMLKNPLYVGLIRHQNELHDGQHESIVDRGLFDAVQAALAEQGPGEAARSKSATTSLLKGIAFDGNGDRLQPAHCNKKGVRYRYYTSARRLRDAGGGSEGIRVPAGDLERLVTTAMADRLSDRNLMQQWLCEDVPVGDHPGLLKRSSELASIIAGIDSECAVLIRCLIEKLIVSKTAISIRLSASGLQQKLGIATSNSPRSEPPRRDDDRNEGGDNVDQLAVTDSMTIAISSHLLRCGKQVKLILGQTIDQPAKANAQLLEMVAKTRSWFEGLTSGRYSTLRSIAREEQCDKSYVSRLLSLAFLAPDIVERIISGSHAPTLTPERLRKACPLPLRWDEQRAILID